MNLLLSLFSVTNLPVSLSLAFVLDFLGGGGVDCISDIPLLREVSPNFHVVLLSEESVRTGPESVRAWHHYRCPHTVASPHTIWVCPPIAHLLALTALRVNLLCRIADSLRYVTTLFNSNHHQTMSRAQICGNQQWTTPSADPSKNPTICTLQITPSFPNSTQ